MICILAAIQKTLRCPIGILCFGHNAARHGFTSQNATSRESPGKYTGDSLSTPCAGQRSLCPGSWSSSSLSWSEPKLAPNPSSSAMSNYCCWFAKKCPTSIIWLVICESWECCFIWSWQYACETTLDSERVPYILEWKHLSCNMYVNVSSSQICMSQSKPCRQKIVWPSTLISI